MGHDLVRRGRQAMRQIGWLLLVATALTVVACASHEPTGAGVAAVTPAVAGQVTYERLCASCHEKGVGGAPVAGDPSAWSGRSSLWLAVLAEHAKSGYLQMPPKGGDEALSDADIEAATVYMLSLTFPDRQRDQ